MLNNDIIIPQKHFFNFFSINKFKFLDFFVDIELSGKLFFILLLICLIFYALDLL